MRAVVIYESMFGNTHSIAEAIAAGLEAMGSVHVGTTDEIDRDVILESNLVVVGGPTHIHGMTSERTRQEAAETAAKDPEIDLDEGAESEGLRDWFDHLPKVDGKCGAAFDTRASGPIILTGSAAKGVSRRMHKHGFMELLKPESFLVEATAGPLTAGETERARHWGQALAEKMLAEQAAASAS